jgi:hypothetical protein
MWSSLVMGSGLLLLSFYEGRLFVCLFCFVLMRSTELGCFRSCSWCPSKALECVLGVLPKLSIVFLVSFQSSWWGGVHGLGSMTFGLLQCKSSLNIEWFLHWKLNYIGAENFRGIGGMCLWCCWKDLHHSNLMEFYVVNFGLRMW